MSKNRELRIRVSETEKKQLKQRADGSNLSQYIRNKLFSDIEFHSNANLEASRAKFKRVPNINRSVYVELSQISSELQQLGNWGEDLSETDRDAIANLRAKIAFLGLEAIGVKQEDSLDL